MNNKMQKPYAVINASRVSSGGGQFLFGSDIKHSTFISLTISNAEYNSDRTVRIFPTKSIIRLNMSAVQWADMLCNMNTMGVPCTIERLQGAEVENYTPTVNKLDVAFRKGKEYLENASTKGLLDNVQKMIADSKLGKKAKSDLEVALRGLDSTLKNNASFYLERFMEEADNVVLDSKAEVEANRAFIMNTLGEIKLNEIKQLNNE